MSIQEFKHIWTTEKDDYILENLGDNNYVILCKDLKSMLVIEDDDVYEAVILKMIESGNKIIN